MCRYQSAGCNQTAVTGRIDTEVDTLNYKIPTLLLPPSEYNDIIIPAITPSQADRGVPSSITLITGTLGAAAMLYNDSLVNKYVNV